MTWDHARMPTRVHVRACAAVTGRWGTGAVAVCMCQPTCAWLLEKKCLKMELSAPS